MKFSLRQMQIFHLVAEHQSVSEAARALHMSQSAASMALSQLESMLGKPLFTRQGRSMELTHWGQWMRPHVHDLLASCHTIEMGMKDLDLVSGKINVGATQTPAEHLVPALVCEMDLNFPRLNLTLEVENTERVIEGLLDYRYDLGIIEGYCDDERIERKFWCKDELVIVASAQHPFAQAEKTSLRQLELGQWVLREKGAGTREIFDSSIHKYLDQIKVHREYEQTNVILNMVAEGNYLTCLSSRSVASWVQRGQLKILNVEGLTISRDFSFAWRKQDGATASRDAIIRAAQGLLKAI